MLSRLTVANLAIVEAAEISFSGGLDVITGETGAGKSVLAGALGLALGARADASAVREGAREATVEAEFSLGADCGRTARLLEEYGLPPCEDGMLVVRRTISASGGGRVRINDAAATVQTLKAIGRTLVDVQGPDDRLSLMDETFQRQLLDSYGRTGTSAYAAAWNSLSALRAELASLRGDTGDIETECENLRYATGEIDGAELSAEDDTELPARHAAAAHAAELIESANGAMAALTGEDRESAAAALSAADALFADMARHHAPAAGWRGELEEIAIRVQELSRAVEDSVSRIETEPDELQALDERLTLVQRLKRKYGAGSVAELLELRDAKAARLAELEGREDRLRKLDGEIAAAEKAVAEAGRTLSAERRKAADRFAAAVAKELHGLGFLKAGFGVEIEPRTADASGCDRIGFAFAPNPGEPDRALAAIASSGEIARVMLAVKTVAAGHDSIPTLVFDEIDSNIGGETGRAVGERLLKVSRHHQVIAITHLAQSAVFGERHLAVSKSVSGGRTRTAIQAIEGEDRVSEIARMLGGEGATGTVRKHARELLASAAKAAAAE